MRRPDGFVYGARDGVLPLLVWAAHFAFAYLFVSLGCASGLGELRLVGGVSAMTCVLLLVSVAALAWLAWAGALSARALLETPAPRDTLVEVRLGATLLAFVGVLWTTLPILMLPPCHSGSTG
jgi:hypothetical protein